MTSAPGGDGVILLPITIFMLSISWVTVLARLYVRKWLKPQAMGADDHLMAAGLVLYSVTCALVIVCCFHGAGQKRAMLNEAEIMLGTKLFYIAEYFYASCTLPIKAAIATTMLRIADTRRRFVYTLWAVIIAQAIGVVIFIISIANICHPITTLWGETTYGTCNAELNSSVGYFFSAVSIVTDLTLAIMPGFLVWHVSLRLRVKVGVTIILGLGAFASCATIIRLRYLTLYNDQAEFMYSTGQIGLWSIVEEGIGITAGSMPALRPILSFSFFNRFSRHSNSDDSHAAAARKNTTNAPLTFGGGRGGVDAVELRNRERRNHKRLASKEEGTTESDGESQKHILKETKVTVTSEQTEGQESAEGLERKNVLGWKKQGGVSREDVV